MDPALKLQALEREQDDVRRYMSLLQLMWYRVRYFPVKSAAIATLVAWASYLTYQQYKSIALMLFLSRIASRLSAGVGVILSLLSQITTAIFKKSKPSLLAKRWMK